MSNKKMELPRPSKRRVHLSELTTDEASFQPRFGGLLENHVCDLCDILRRGQDLDPMSVWEDPATGCLFVVDGHHRLEAHRRVSTGKKIGVHVYRCDQAIAKLLSMEDNSKTKVSLNYDEKANWAWRNDAELDLPKSVIAAKAGIAPRTVGYQRSVRRQLLASDEDLPDTWKEARRRAQGAEPRDWTDEQREAAMIEEVQRADKQFGSSLTELIRRWPEAAAELIAKCAGENNLRRMADHLGWVAVDDTEDGGISLLGMKIGEVYTEDEIDRIAAIAKEGPQF